MPAPDIDPGNVARKLKPFRLQFSLWFFLLFVLFASLMCAIFVQHFNERKIYKTDFRLLQGNWDLVRLGSDGEILETNYGWWRISGNIVESRLFSTVTNNTHFMLTINPNRSLKEINLTNIDTQKSGHGIYTIDGGTLTVCLTDIDNPRPTDFQIKKGDKKTLLVFQRNHD